MTKEEALSLFGGRPIDLAKALGVTKAAVSNWPPGELSQNLADRVVGAHVRNTKMKNGRRYTGKPVKML
jgi:hypothetical protein